MKIKSPSAAFKIFLLLAFFSLFWQIGSAQENKPFSINESPLPAPTGFVNDYAGVIDSTTKQRLETKLRDFKQKTNPPVEIAVAVVETTGGRPIFDYSLAVARGWGIGSKAVDNPGALLFIAIGDRKYFTQVSRDLEDELPDGLVGSLQRQYLVPEFKNGNYAKGIEDTVNAYIRTIEARQSGQPLPDADSPAETEKDIFDAIPTSVCRGICVIGVVIFILIIISGASGGKGGRGGGGGGGGGIASALLWAVLSGAASGGGGSSSSGWGGGSGGGGSDWGGFGGGGDFGGGGAGGGW